MPPMGGGVDMAKTDFNWLTPMSIEQAVEFSLYDLYKFQIPRDSGYIYLMWAQGTNFFKIGYSENPERRLSEINRAATKMPFQVMLLAQWYTPTMRLSEAYLHRIFKDMREEGEWFLFNTYTLSLLGEIGTPRVIAASLYRQLLNHAHQSNVVDINRAIQEFPQFEPEALGAKSIGLIEDIIQNSLAGKGVWFWEENSAFAQTPLAAQIKGIWEDAA